MTALLTDSDRRKFLIWLRGKIDDGETQMRLCREQLGATGPLLAERYRYEKEACKIVERMLEVDGM